MHKQLTYLRAKSRGPQPRGICVCLPPYVSVLPSTTIHNHTHSAHASANISPPPPFLPPMHSTSASAQIWLCITKSATAPVLPVRGGGEGGGDTPIHGHALRRRSLAEMRQSISSRGKGQRLRGKGGGGSGERKSGSPSLWLFLSLSFTLSLLHSYSVTVTLPLTDSLPRSHSSLSLLSLSFFNTHTLSLSLHTSSLPPSLPPSLPLSPSLSIPLPPSPSLSPREAVIPPVEEMHESTSADATHSLVLQLYALLVGTPYMGCSHPVPRASGGVELEHLLSSEQLAAMCALLQQGVQRPRACCIDLSVPRDPATPSLVRWGHDYWCVRERARERERERKT